MFWKSFFICHFFCAREVGNSLLKLLQSVICFAFASSESECFAFLAVSVLSKSEFHISFQSQVSLVFDRRSLLHFCSVCRNVLSIRKQLNTYCLAQSARNSAFMTDLVWQRAVKRPSIVCQVLLLPSFAPLILPTQSQFYLSTLYFANIRRLFRLVLR